MHGWREWVFGMPWVFERLRRWTLGGFDFAPAYRYLDVRSNDVVLDIGCGTGDAMAHLAAFREYHGFDIDARAIDAFARRHSRPEIRLYARRSDPADVARIAPTKVVMVGVLHHMTDAEAKHLLRSLRGVSTVQRIATVDTVFLPGHIINNALARLDRGRHVRTEEGYKALARAAGFTVERSFWIETGRRVARYYAMVLKPAA
jgi:SAM-dependent methyltransferase